LDRDANGYTEVRAIAAEGMAVTGQVNLRRALVTGRAAFGGVSMPDGFVIAECRFGRDLVLARSSVGDLSMAGVRIEGRLDMQAARVGGKFAIPGGTVTGMVLLRGATIEGGVDLSATHLGCIEGKGLFLKRHCRLEDATVDGALNLCSLEARGRVTLDRVKVGGRLRLDQGVFAQDIRLDRLSVDEDLWADEARFAGAVDLNRAAVGRHMRCRATQFGGNARFYGVVVGGTAWFTDAVFNRDVSFRGAAFARQGRFEGARVHGELNADGIVTEGPLRFEATVVDGRATFAEGTFISAQTWELTANGGLNLARAAFRDGLDASLSAPMVDCSHGRFGAESNIRMRRGVLLMDNTSFRRSSVIAGDPVDDDSSPPRLASTRYADLRNVVISTLDLRECAFSGAHNLDGVRLDASVLLNGAPRGIAIALAFPPIVWWSKRETLIEEHLWRQGRRNGAKWRLNAPAHAPSAQTAGEVAALYRALRKGREDARDQPGSASFYYGEMEMRRRQARAFSADRIVLSLYWLFAGYGLRPGRPLAALLASLTLFAGLFQVYGFEDTAHPFASAQAGVSAPLVQRPVGRLPDSLNDLRAAYSSSDAWTYSVTAASAIAGGPDARLTPAGRIYRALLRVLGPIFIGLTLLSVRARVKR
jgi:uncharacterized protein YjbI with pentapeptide repeats